MKLIIANRAYSSWSMRGWLAANVHAHGRRYPAAELCARATGGPPGAGEFVGYLREKLARFYGVC